MAHSGQWKSRMVMAWATWGLGAIMIIGGGAGLFMGKETGSLIMSGASMVTSVVAIIVGGKVFHDMNNGEKL